MTNSIIYSYVSDAIILFIASFVGVFLSKKYNIVSLYKILLQKNSLDTANNNSPVNSESDNILQGNYDNYQSPWRLILQKDFLIEASSVFFFLLFLFSVFKYYRYL